jgi:phosphoribosyl 1,2-cyclic phosphodiesterase
MTAKPKTSRRATDSFAVKFWGVRGSYPTTDPSTRGYGGNTSCVEVSVAGHRLIFDAGTGIIPLGQALQKNSNAPAPSYVFLSHTHIDHIIGLCFFAPLLTPNTQTYILGPGINRQSLTNQLQLLTRTSLFPVTLEELKGEKEICSLHGDELIHFSSANEHLVIRRRSKAAKTLADDLTIATHKSPAHPRDGVMLYRVTYRGKSVVYATDIEQRENGYPDVIEFARGADLLIHDAQYLRGEYYSRTKSKRGWGHSTIQMAAAVAKKANVKRLVLYHHEPLHDDRAMREIAKLGKRLFAAALVAHEGMELSLL